MRRRSCIVSHHSGERTVFGRKVFSDALLADGHVQNIGCVRSLSRCNIQHTLDERPHVHAIVRGYRWELAFQHFFEQAVHVLCAERWHQGTHFINDAPKRPNIRLKIIGLIAPYLGTCVIGCSSLCVKQSFFCNLAHVEVSKLSRPVTI